MQSTYSSAQREQVGCCYTKTCINQAQSQCFVTNALTGWAELPLRRPARNTD